MGDPCTSCLRPGVKGVGLAGADAALEEDGWEPQCVAGASAGVITAALVAAGCSGVELREAVLALQFREFKHEAWEDRIPIIGKQTSILRDYRVYERRRFPEWVTEKLARKGVTIFGDLEPTRNAPSASRSSPRTSVATRY
jgi:NTE family protein